MAVAAHKQEGRLTTENGPVSSGLAVRRMLRRSALVAGEVKSSRPTDARTPPIATAPPPTNAALTDTTACLRGAQVAGNNAQPAAAGSFSQGAAMESPAANRNRPQAEE